MEEKDLSFFKKIKMSIIDIDKYNILAQEKIKKTLGYLLILVFVFAVIMALIYTAEYKKEIDKAIFYFKENLPDFSYKNGIITSENNEVIKLNYSTIYSGDIIIDLMAENDENYIQNIDEYKNSIIVLKDKILKYNEEDTKYSEIKIEELINSLKIENGQESYNKQQIFNEIEETYSKQIQSSTVLFYTLYITVALFLTIFTDLIILTLIGLILGNLLKIRFKYKSVFNMAVYSYTLSIILKMIYYIVNYFTKFEIKYFDYMYSLIAYIYMIAAICIIKNDMTKKQLNYKEILEEEKPKIKSIDDEVKKETKPREKKDDSGEAPEGANIE